MKHPFRSKDPTRDITRYPIKVEGKTHLYSNGLPACGVKNGYSVTDELREVTCLSCIWISSVHWKKNDTDSYSICRVDKHYPNSDVEWTTEGNEVTCEKCIKFERQGFSIRKSKTPSWFPKKRAM